MEGRGRPPGHRRCQGVKRLKRESACGGHAASRLPAPGCSGGRSPQGRRRPGSRRLPRRCRGQWPG
eukprot:2540686-Alexandrium_andersonii.AAC.1